MGSKAVLLTDGYLKSRRQFESIHTFCQITSDDEYTLLATSGTIAALAERGGGISITTQAADNAEGTAVMNVKPALIAAGKSMLFAATLQFAEAATNAANVLAGLHSGAIASALTDDGVGPPASYSGIAFFKVDGSLNWQIELSVGGTQTTVELTAGNSFDKTAHVAGSTSYQLLEIEVLPKTAALADVIFKIDDVVVYKVTDWTYTSSVAMAPCAVIKAGSSTAEVMKLRRIDFVGII